MASKPKFKIGHQVMIIKYGHRFWSYEIEPGTFPVLYDNKEEGYKVYDMLPELVGQVGVISNASKTQGQWQYSLNGINGKSSWYDEQQLEKVLPTPKNKKLRGPGTSKVKTDRTGR